MAKFVEVVIVVALVFSMTPWRDHRLAAIVPAPFQQAVGIISFIGKKAVSQNAVDEGFGLTAIGCRALRDDHPDGQPMRVYGQVQLAV